MKKLNEISYYEVFLCLLVILIHVMSECISGYITGTFLSAASFFVSRAATFVVPAFIMSSGIKLFRKHKDRRFDYLPFIKTRLTKIYLPFLFWVAAYYLYFVFRLRYFPFSIKDMASYLLLGNIASPFYFVIIIMQLYITFPLWLRLLKRIPPLPAILAAMLVTVLSQYLLRDFTHSDKVFTSYLVYWITGGAIGLNYERFTASAKRLRVPLVALGACFTVLYAGMAYAEFMGLYGSFFTEVIKLLFSIFASLMYLAIMPRGESAVIQKLAAVTYYVYLIHSLIIFEVNHDMTVLGITSISQRLVIRAAVVYTLSFALCLAWRKIKLLKKC